MHLMFNDTSCEHTQLLVWHRVCLADHAPNAWARSGKFDKRFCVRVPSRLAEHRLFAVTCQRHTSHASEGIRHAFEETLLKNVEKFEAESASVVAKIRKR